MRKIFIRIISCLISLTDFSFAQNTFMKLYNFSQLQTGYQVSEVDTNQLLFITDIADCGACPHLVHSIKVNLY